MHRYKLDVCTVSIENIVVILIIVLELYAINNQLINWNVVIVDNLNYIYNYVVVMIDNNVSVACVEVVVVIHPVESGNDYVSHIYITLCIG